LKEEVLAVFMKNPEGCELFRHINEFKKQSDALGLMKNHAKELILLRMNDVSGSFHE